MDRIASLMVKRPCLGCVYFPHCGSTTRTEKCLGRETKSMKKKEAQKNGVK